MPNVGKIVTTRCVFSAGRCAKMRWRLGIRPGPRWGVYSVPPDPLAGLMGPTSKERGGEKGEEEEGRRREKKRGKCPLSEILKTPLL